MAQKMSNDENLPTMIIFDLDDCLWTPEMHELYEDKPSIPVHGSLDPDADADANTDGNNGNSTRRPSRTAKRKYSTNKKNTDNDVGVVGLQVPGASQMVYLYNGARRALCKIATQPQYKDVLIAAASSSLEPSYSHACLNAIEILPGLTMWEMFHYDEIGRTGHLTSRKTTHFNALHRNSQVPYREMLFFDDCNWGDHCQDVWGALRVMIGQRTPDGLSLEEFHEGLEKFRKSQIKDE